MPEPLRLTVVTPAGVVWDKEAQAVTLQTAAGQIKVLPGHAAIVTLLEPGEMWIGHDNSEELFVAGEGFAEILNNRVTVFTDLAENVQDVDLEAAEKAKRRAEHSLAEAADLTDDERRAAELSVRESALMIEISARAKQRRESAPPR